MISFKHYLVIVPLPSILISGVGTNEPRPLPRVTPGVVVVTAIVWRVRGDSLEMGGPRCTRLPILSVTPLDGVMARVCFFAAESCTVV